MPVNEGLAKLAGKEQERLGLPGDAKFYTPAPFGSMNQQDARTAIDDHEFYLIENWFLVGKSALRTTYDHGPALYTAPAKTTIVYYYWFTINQLTACAVFLSDGTAVQVDLQGNVTTITNQAGTFYNGGQLPVACQSGTLFLLIANNVSPNNYWIWDGTILYAPGTIGPFIIGDLTSGGSNYTSAPTVTIYGGAGSGATANATIENGSVVAVNVTNAGSGYNPTDYVAVGFSGGGTDSGAVLQAVLTSSGVEAVVVDAGGSGYTIAPTVVISGGGGQFAGATANISNGAVTSFTVTAPGTGYTFPPTVTLTGGNGSGAAASAVLAISGVSNIQVVAGGHGYTGAPTVTITGGGGTGAAATATITNGSVTGIQITATGSGYTSTPSVALSGGGGSGASAVAVLTVASVASVNVITGGSGYTGTPTLTFLGGGGTGAAGTAVVTSGSITSVTMTAAGSGYSSPPTVEIQAGVNNAASATIAIMPFGISGTSIETFQSRVWVSNPADVGKIDNGGVINVSAPASVTDFASSDGGDLFTSSDRFLRAKYVSIHQSNAFLYTLADSSVSVISNVQTSGSPTTTTFNYQNSNPQLGVAWRDTVQDFGQSVLFANANGICGLYGGSVRKVSAKMNDIFVNAIFPPTPGAITPTAAVMNILTIPVYLLNMTIRDPVTGALRNVMVGWNEKEWFLISQSISLTFIATLEVNSVMTAWGTDGNALYPLLTTPSSTLNKRLVTKEYGGEREYIVKEAMVNYIRATDKSANQSGVAFNITMDTNGIAQQIGQMPQMPCGQFVNPVQPNFLAPNYTAPIWGGITASVVGTSIGAIITTTSPDVILSGLSIAYRDVSAIWG